MRDKVRRTYQPDATLNGEPVCVVSMWDLRLVVDSGTIRPEIDPGRWEGDTYISAGAEPGTQVLKCVHVIYRDHDSNAHLVWSVGRWWRVDGGRSGPVDFQFVEEEKA